jgi:hypothetical protein
VTNLERILKHYRKQAHNSETASAYALGVVAMAEKLKAIRDEWQRDLSDLWRTRQGAPPQAKATMSVLRAVIRSLDNIDDPQHDDKAKGN